MKHGSLFSGIGGFDLAAEWMGWENVFHCEWNPFGQRILKHYWPNAKSYNDITKTDFTEHRGAIDILTGGFPCQPYSLAGKRKGKADDRHLWPEMLRAIREIQPSWVVGENVFGIVNWNGGMVFDEVQADLEAEGYEVQPFILPACAVNAPHRRGRVWFVAHTDSKRFQKRESLSKHHEQRFEAIKRTNSFGAFTNNYSIGRLESNGWAKAKFNSQDFKHWRRFPTQSAVCGGNDGVPTRLDGITVSSWRRHSIEAFGNAIVPQVAYQIFKAIEQYSSLK